MQKTIYLDNNATTPIHPRIKKVILEAMEQYGNPSSMHYVGQASRNAVEMARVQISESIGAKPGEILFTGSGTEANNAIVHTIFENAFNRQKNVVQPSNGHYPHVITSAIEHPSMLSTLDYYRRKGLEVTYIPVDHDGIVDVENIKMNIRENTRLISIMHANNETGTIQPIEEISKIAEEHEVTFHTDAVQAFGKIPVNVSKMNIDMLTISGHKIYAPKGIGALYIKKGTPFMPFIYGGHQELNRRAGTENVLGIIAMGKAAEIVKNDSENENEKIARLKNKLKNGLKEKIPGIFFNGSQEHCLPNTLNVTFKYIEGESILLYADFEGIALSTGSACSTGSLEPSHVIMAFGFDAEHAHGSVRFSLGRENTEEDIDHVLKKLPGVIERLRKMSPLYLE